jgi:hypothetical protein
MRRSSGRFASASAAKVNNVRFRSLPTLKREACRPLGANGGQIAQQAAAVAAGQFTTYKILGINGRRY